MMALDAPSWVAELLDGSAGETSRVDGVLLRARLGRAFSLVSARIANARLLGREALGDAVYRCYSMIADSLQNAAARHPVRFWNHLCHIHEAMGEGMDRYMAFNVGRFRAFDEWYGGEANFGRCVATASGVGCDGEDITIHVLAAREPGVAVANPRQVPPFGYSQRFGPRPPCFARATAIPALGGQTAVLIGGTASICGEESVFVGDLSGQLAETFRNIHALMQQAGGSLMDVDDLRIYAPDTGHWEAIRLATQDAMPNAKIELVRADLCRRELLVEIEGRAMLKGIS